MSYIIGSNCDNLSYLFGIVSINSFFDDAVLLAGQQILIKWKKTFSFSSGRLRVENPIFCPLSKVENINPFLFLLSKVENIFRFPFFLRENWGKEFQVAFSPRLET